MGYETNSIWKSPNQEVLMPSLFKWVFRILEDVCSSPKNYGKVTITVQRGKIVHVEKALTLKPPEGEE